MAIVQDLIILNYEDAVEEYPHGCILAYGRILNQHKEMDEWMYANIDRSRYSIRGVFTRDRDGEPAESYGLWVGFKRKEDFVKFCLTWL